MILRNFSTFFVTVIIASLLVACGGGDDGNVRESDLVDMSLGPADSPMVLIEYASTTCGACGNYHKNMSETIKQLAAEGKLRFIFREFPRDPVDIAAFVTARCAGPDKYFDVLDDMFSSQQGLFASMRNNTARASLQTIAQRHGVDAAKFEACLNDETIREQIENAREFGIANGVGSTPTLFFNGVMLVGTEAHSPESLMSLMDGTP